MPKHRYSIWGREYSADHDVELAQCDSNPLAVKKGYEAKMLTIRHPPTSPGPRTTKVHKFYNLRIVDHGQETG